MSNTILVLNVGSSSIKFALYPAQVTEQPLMRGKIEGIGSTPRFSAHDGSGMDLGVDGLGQLENAPTHGELTKRLLDWLKGYEQASDLLAVGHRVVHGGRAFTEPVVISADVLGELETLVSLAPLHQPHNLAAIRAISNWAPGLPQVACFDTSFHRTQPRLAELFALPRRLTEAGVIRYGFHGLSYQYIADALPQHLGARSEGRVIVAHLGNGASMCALHQRRSIATSMGFTALDGLMMGQRCGSLDAGVVLHLQQNQGLSLEQVQQLLYRESGLLGVSGISNQMQELLQSSDPHAREAIDLFCYRAACEVGSLATALQGLDAIVFTAGIGENQPPVRQAICDRLGWLGVELAPEANDRNATTISRADSKVTVLALPTNEEIVIASAVRELTSLAPMPDQAKP